MRVESADAAEQPGQSVGRRVVASTGGENTQDLNFMQGVRKMVSATAKWRMAD